MFLGVFENLQKASLSFVISVFPSVLPPPTRMEQLGSSGLIFLKFDI
jgi:hypothetical protein